MRRRADDIAASTGLDNPPRIHDGDPVGNLDRNADVVGDKYHRKPEFPLELPKQQKNLDLHRGIERGGRLVCEQNLRPARERQRDHGALAHAAGHLMGIIVKALRRRRDAYALEQLQRPRPSGAPRHAIMAHHGLGDLVAEAIDGVKGEPRLLEDHRNRAAPIGGEVAVR